MKDTMFDDWAQHEDARLAASLLWEHDLEGFDWDDMRSVVVQRVIERGWPDDFYAAIRLYGGMDNFRNIIKQVPVLSDKDIYFVCAVFNLEKSELRCYTRKQSREKLLTVLMQDKSLQSFYLAGGTALALYMGHRLSVDLDLFTPEPFDARELERYLAGKYRFKGDFLEKNTLKGSINEVKVDCITYDYPLVESPLTTRVGIRLGCNSN